MRSFIFGLARTHENRTEPSRTYFVFSASTSFNMTTVRLADFIESNTEAIVSEWEAFARTLRPAANDMTSLALRNHIHEILAFVVNDINSPQSPTEQMEKSRGEANDRAKATAARTHAALRLAGGFSIGQMVSEYRALRASVVKQWSVANTEMAPEDMIDVTRFNESIDQALEESVSLYTESVGHSKDLLLAVLGHDLRNPLNAISMSAQLTISMGGLNERQRMLNAQISDSTSRITAILNDLLSVTRSRFNARAPVMRAPMDMGFVSRQIVDEFRVLHPSRMIILEVSGDLKGEWDKARVGQAFSNLIGNAIQYSFKDTSIVVGVTGTPREVILSVHNEGVPIPPEKLETIFTSLTRSGSEADPQSTNLGLGLYITKDILISHNGSLAVTSNEDGTEFIAHFPRAESLRN